MTFLMDRSRSLAQMSAAARREPGAGDGWFSIRNAADTGGDADTAEVVIYAEIGWFGKTAQDFMDELRGITARNITLRVNSPGGDIFDGIAIYNLLQAHPATVTAYVDSLAASIASVITMSADRVVMMPHSQLMIHDGSGGCWGNAADMRSMADLLDRQSDNIAGVYSDRAGGQMRSWRNRMKEETWYTAAEAVAAGLADEVATIPRRPGAGAADDDEGATNRWDLSVYQLAGLFRFAGRYYAPAPTVDPDPVTAATVTSATGTTTTAAADVKITTTPAQPRARTRIVDVACPTHHTDTNDADDWDAGENEGRLTAPLTVARAKAMYAWYDAEEVDGGEVPKSACSLPHHDVGDDGEPGAANLAAVRNALGQLADSDIPEDDHEAVRSHLEAHLDDGKSEDRADPPVADTTAPKTPPGGQDAPAAPAAAEIDDPAAGADWDGVVANLLAPSTTDDWESSVAHLIDRGSARRHRTTA